MANRRLTTADAAQRLGGITPQRVRDLIREGELAAERIGDRFVLDADQVEYLAGRRASGAFARVVAAERAKGADASRHVDRMLADLRKNGPWGMTVREMRRRAKERGE